MTRDGSLRDCEFITVESEFAAMSAAIGASAAGARAYTATASQGLLYMAEALFNAAGLGLPIVMTVANRAIGAPINIWNDHSDAMSQRDCGWIQLYAADNQDAVALHVIAFRLAESLSVPVMVCVDGFVLTHAFEPIELPTQEAVDAFLPRYTPRQTLDPDNPVAIGAMVGPDAFTEVRWLADRQLRRAEAGYARVSADYAELTGRHVPVIDTYRMDGARTVVVTLGSVGGTVRDAIDQCDGAVGLVSLSMFRPFPAAALRAVIGAPEHVVVLERAFAPGSGGTVTPDVARAIEGTGATVSTVVAGLGGRPVTTESVVRLLARARFEGLPEQTFLDLRTDVVAAQEPQLQGEFA